MSELTGKTIIEKTELQQNETIDLSSFDTGVYIVSIQTDKEVFTTKVVKK
ncbi:MAG: T9SS type A sorting domain-containing protein [Bacteroidales bacterium]|nr:T9SS type A sorting domain-containing protein [Bacteroidales bacterium]